MLKCFWLNQWKFCVSMVHTGDCLRAVWDMKRLFPPHSRLSGVNVGHRVVIWGGIQSASQPSYGPIQVGHCIMNKPPAISCTQEDGERFHLKDKTEVLSM